MFISGLKDMQTSYNSLVTDLRAVQIPGALPTRRQLNNLALQVQQLQPQPIMQVAPQPIMQVAPQPVILRRAP